MVVGRPELDLAGDESAIGGVIEQAKPDIVASGMGTVSLSDPGSLFYQTKAAYLVDGRIDTNAPL